MPRSNAPVSTATAILIRLSEGAGHGYELRKWTERRLGIRLYDGTFYPALGRLIEKGLASSAKETPAPCPRRRSRLRVFYSLTARGRQAAERIKTQLVSLLK